jgi:hypothetical protein
MARRRPDLPSLVAGAALTLFGAVVLLDRLDVIDLRFDALAPLVCAVVGAILLTIGITRRD